MELTGQSADAGGIPIPFDDDCLFGGVNGPITSATDVERLSQHFRGRVGNLCRVNEIVEPDAQLVDGPSPLRLLPYLRFSNRSFGDICSLNKYALGPPIGAHNRLKYEVNVALRRRSIRFRLTYEQC